MKDNSQKYRFLICISVLLIFLLIYIIQSTNSLESKVYSNLNNKVIKETETLIYYDNYSAIAIHYPSLGNHYLNTNIDTILKKHLQDFETLTKNSKVNSPIYKGELNIDYNIYNPIDEIISIRFNIMKNLPYYAHPDIEINTINYDLLNQKELSLDDIMKGKYLEFISKASKDYFKDRERYEKYIDTRNFQEYLAPIEDNYSNFLLHDNYINFLFPKYTMFPGYLGVSEVKIPYEKMAEYIDPLFLKGSSRETFSVNYNKFTEIEVIKSRNINPNKPMIALTFDDGPNTSTTGPILDTLKEHESVATFFVLGNRVKEHSNIIHRIIREGSEIGNHSYNHKQLTTISSTEVKDQINQTQDNIIEVSGFEPQLMRPTYGSYDEKLQAQLDMPIVLWSIDTEDWKSKNPKKIVNHVLENVKDGDIILMHDIYSSTAKAVEELVPALIDRGYQLVTVSELYETQGEVLEVGNIYNRR